MLGMMRLKIGVTVESGAHPPWRRQRGSTLLVLLTMVTLAGSAMLLHNLNSVVENRLERDQRTAEALAEAKETLIGWTVSHPSNPGMMLWPDRHGDGDYDGTTDCANSPTFNDAWLLGKIPWLGAAGICVTEHAGLGINLVDGDGEQLWMAVSRNLIREYNPKRNPVINPALLTSAAHPWLTVRDSSGGVVSNRVAFVILSPGPALDGQDRSSAASPANYLDSVTVDATSYDNSDADYDFISFPNSALTADTTDSFNDRLVYITIDELMTQIERRAMGEVADVLQEYRNDHGVYPWMGSFADPTQTSLAVRHVAGAGSGSNTLADGTQNFLAPAPTGLGLQPGDVVHNITDGTKGMITGVGTTTLNVDPLGVGVSVTFDDGDEYEVRTQLAGSAAVSSSGQRLEDSGKNFLELGVLPGDVVHNLTDGSRGLVTTVGTPADSNLDVELIGGAEDDFDPGDYYVVSRSNGNIGVREGLLAFHEAGEPFVTAFTADWNITSDNGAIVDSTAGSITSYTASYDTAITSAIESSVAGAVEASAGDGLCVWTDESEVDCYVAGLYLSGDATAGSSGTVLEHTGRSFSTWGVRRGDKVRNLSDGSSGLISSVSADTVATPALSGGLENDFDAGESYQIRVATQTVNGTETVGGTGTTLTDTLNFVLLGVEAGDTVVNVDDGSVAVVQSVAANTLTLAPPGLTGGSDNLFEVDDDYQVRMDFVDSRTYFLAHSGSAARVDDLGMRRRTVCSGVLLDPSTCSQLATGTATSGSAGLLLQDLGADFVDAGVQVDDMLENSTDGSRGIVTAVTGTTLSVASLASGTNNTFQPGDSYTVHLTSLLPAQPSRPVVQIVDVDVTGAEVGRATVTVPAGGSVGSIITSGLQFDLVEGVDFPSWLVANDWDQLIYIAVSDGYRPGAAGSCVAGGTPDCLTLTNWYTPVNDKEAVILSAGVPLSGQDRSTGLLTAYLENDNGTVGDDVFEYSDSSNSFNDQIRVIEP